jgi:hypothetical protein
VSGCLYTRRARAGALSVPEACALSRARILRGRCHEKVEGLGQCAAGQVHAVYFYARHHFAPEVIEYAVWLCLGFILSYRDVEELLAERDLEVSYETVRRLVLKFGPGYARNLRRLRSKPAGI